MSVRLPLIAVLALCVIVAGNAFTSLGRITDEGVNPAAGWVWVYHLVSFIGSFGMLAVLFLACWSAS